MGIIYDHLIMGQTWEKYDNAFENGTNIGIICNNCFDNGTSMGIIYDNAFDNVTNMGIICDN